ncbi:hypothetical protein IEQ34_016069 [Dendrobium chrysotoxum]|uniref:Uncharacterized protein n=1 Tax=Dendrobium chrysotoxum TaxID=161865 RepID=A0AAV7GEI8_DENCH|nr:hypothetical protein IEQ34_016069 [Dendrobium chrysotoxum]
MAIVQDDGMDYQKQHFERKGNPLPRRGQVRARIFGSLVRSIIPSPSKNQTRKRQRPEASSTMLTPGTSGYTSDECSEA